MKVMTGAAGDSSLQHNITYSFNDHAWQNARWL